MAKNKCFFISREKNSSNSYKNKNKDNKTTVRVEEIFRNILSDGFLNEIFTQREIERRANDPSPHVNKNNVKLLSTVNSHIATKSQQEKPKQYNLIHLRN